MCLAAFVVFNAHEKASAAAPGALDPGFGAAGFVKTNILGIDNIFDMTTQPDGKIIAVGGCDVGDFTIVRYLANGALDPTFSSDGIVFVDFGSTIEAARGVKVQTDGKIVVTGNTSSGTGVVRLNADGSLDTTFDTDGKVIISIVNGSFSRGLELQPDGKIVLGGGSITNFGIARLNPNGLLDTTFDTDGIVSTNLTSTVSLEDMKIQPNGRIVAVGTVATFSMSVVVRYLSNGSLDTSFSGDGIAVNDFSPADESARSLVIDPISETITTVGANNAGTRSMLIVRYLSNGNLDTSFSGDGILEINDPIKRGASVVQQSDRKFVFSGDDGGLDNVRLVRVNLNGTIDTGFGSNGFVDLKDNVSGNQKLLALLGDKLIIGNHANSTTDFGIERVNLSATPTQSGDFDGDGFSDYAIFRPSTAEWFILRSLNSTVQVATFGLAGDVPMDGDFDGDGRSDYAIFRPASGEWWINRSTTGATVAFQFGLSSDRPVPGDYDKDGKTDVGLFRPSTGEWLILRSSSGGTTFFGFPFGSNGDIPIARQGL